MKALRYNFIVFECVGLWRPVRWSPGWKTKLYDAYTWFMVFFMSSMTVSEFIDLMGSINNVEAFANNSFILLTMVSICGKALNILVKRNEVIKLENILQNDLCHPRTNEESVIQDKFDQLTRLNTVRYGALTGIGVFVIVMSSFVKDVPRKTLPFPTWLPYNHTTVTGFWIAYLHQILSHVVGAYINVAFDTLVPGLMLQTCGQLNILKHRIGRVPSTVTTCDRKNEVSEKSIKVVEVQQIAGCVKHHLEIFKFAETSNEIFSFVIFLQYTVSTIVLCVSVFGLSKTKLFSPEFFAIFMYLACMSLQIFMFCLYGYEVTLESLNIGDAIYEMNWSTLGITAQRSLVMIMLRSLRPIEFTSVHIVKLNIESFNSLVKLSYSAFNVLQQSQE
nr:olfactory receptor 42 [Gregopimpla kuwanae]